MSVVQAVHDTVHIVLRDTTVVRDTIIRLAEPARGAGIGWRDAIGWGVTIVSIAVATLVARVGWAKSAESQLNALKARQKMEDDRAITILRDGIREALGGAIMLLPILALALESRHQLQRSTLALLDVGMDAYRRNRDSIVLWKDETERGAIQLWFREAEHWRHSLEAYINMAAIPASATVTDPRVVALTVLELKGSLEGAKNLYMSLGFPAVWEGDKDFEKWGGKNTAPPTAGPAAP